MADCPSQHPNAAGATFCTTCGLPMGQSPTSPSVQGLLTPISGNPAPEASAPPTAVGPPVSGTTGNGRAKTPLIALISAGGAIVIGLLTFLFVGPFGGPEMDTESPRTLLMDSRDFEFDMVVDSEGLPFLAGEYSFFGEDCSQNRQAGDLLERSSTRSSASFMSGEGLYQFIAFDQALIRFPDAEDATELVDVVRAGSQSSSCESDYENISTNYSGTTTLESFGFSVEDSVVYYGRTEIDSTILDLDATLRRVFVLAAQDRHVLVISAAIDASTSYVSFGELEGAVEYALDKAYGEVD